MIRLLKHLVLPWLLFLAFFSLSLSHPRPTLATANFTQARMTPGLNLESFIAGKLAPGGGSGMIPILMDTITTSIVGAYDSSGNRVAFGATNYAGGLMANLYRTQPLSSVDYLADISQRIGLAKPTIAAGRGSEFLTADSQQAILKLWKVARNTTYIFFIIIFVIIGLMIMFRTKLNPQTVVSLQLALPRIIISLILVTFSFAISGLIIDTVYVGHSIIGTIYFKSSASPLSALPADKTDPHSLDFIAGLFSGGAFGGVDVISSLGKFIGSLGDLLFSGLCKAFASLGFGSLVDCGGGGLTDKIIPLIFAFTLLGTGIKILFALITKYVTLILQTIFSPFVFLLSALPGRQESIAGYFKTMLAAALTFPAIAFMFFLASYFISGIDLPGLPPLNKVGTLAPGTAPIAGQVIGETGRVLEPLIALGILMATAQVPQAIDQMLSVKPSIAGAVTPDIGAAIRKIPLIGSMLG